VEEFSPALEFRAAKKTRIVYASSASTYARRQRQAWNQTAPAPSNVYAFRKRSCDNLAIREAKENPSWTIIGCVTSKRLRPRGAHKGVPASMVYHLAQQMKAGQPSAHFQTRRPETRFRYVKDVIEGSILALEAKQSGIYNLGSGQARSNSINSRRSQQMSRGQNFSPTTSIPHAH